MRINRNAYLVQEKSLEFLLARRGDPGDRGHPSLEDLRLFNGPPRIWYPGDGRRVHRFLVIEFIFSGIASRLVHCLRSNYLILHSFDNLKCHCRCTRLVQTSPINVCLTQSVSVFMTGAATLYSNILGRKDHDAWMVQGRAPDAKWKGLFRNLNHQGLNEKCNGNSSLAMTVIHFLYFSARLLEMNHQIWRL